MADPSDDEVIIVGFGVDESIARRYANDRADRVVDVDDDVLQAQLQTSGDTRRALARAQAPPALAAGLQTLPGYLVAQGIAIQQMDARLRDLEHHQSAPRKRGSLAKHASRDGPASKPVKAKANAAELRAAKLEVEEIQRKLNYEISQRKRAELRLVTAHERIKELEGKGKKAVKGASSSSSDA